MPHYAPRYTICDKGGTRKKAFSWNSIFGWHCYGTTHTLTATSQTKHANWHWSMRIFYCLWLTSDKNEYRVSFVVCVRPNLRKLPHFNFSQYSLSALKTERISFALLCKARWCISWMSTTCVRRTHTHEIECFAARSSKNSNALCTRLLLGICTINETVWCATYA